MPWQIWGFQGSQEHEYSIYIHTKPGYVYTKETTKCDAFLDRQLKNSIPVHDVIIIKCYMCE
jgi:hypothetical protein